MSSRLISAEPTARFFSSIFSSSLALWLISSCNSRVVFLCWFFAVTSHNSPTRSLAAWNQLVLLTFLPYRLSSLLKTAYHLAVSLQWAISVLFLFTVLIFWFWFCAVNWAGFLSAFNVRWTFCITVVFDWTVFAAVCLCVCLSACKCKPTAVDRQ